MDHNLLLEKLVHLGLPPFLIGWTASFLHERQQRVKLGSSCQSDWTSSNAGVPQGTLIGPVAFLLHINSLHTDCNDVKYVDDTTVWESCSSDGGDSKLQGAADDVLQWTITNNMSLNVDKTKEMIITNTREDPDLQPLTLLGQPVERVDTFKLLGIHLSNKLSWKDHVAKTVAKASKRLYFLCLLKRAGLAPPDIIKVYVAMIRSILEYGCEIWHPGLTKQSAKELEHVQKRALRIALPHLSYEEALSVSGLSDLVTRRETNCKSFLDKMSKSSHVLHRHLPPRKTSDHNLRAMSMFHLPAVRTERAKKSPIFYGLFQF